MYTMTRKCPHITQMSCLSEFQGTAQTN
jgi:hypothetical protein